MGGAVARAFAGEGATVFLAGRTLAKLDVVANEIRAAGGAAETAAVDALDQQAVEEPADEVIKRAGRFDISFNAISITAVQNVPLVELWLDDFMTPITEAARTHFITAIAAAKRMTAQGSGVIVLLSSSPDGRLQPRVRGHRGVHPQPGRRGRPPGRPRRRPAPELHARDRSRRAGGGPPAAGEGHAAGTPSPTGGGGQRLGEGIDLVVQPLEPGQPADLFGRGRHAKAGQVQLRPSGPTGTVDRRWPAGPPACRSSPGHALRRRLLHAHLGSSPPTRCPA